MSKPTRAEKAKRQASEQASYEKKIAELRSTYLQKKEGKRTQRQQASKKANWQKIRQSIPHLISILPTRSHSELLAIYQKCSTKMAGHNATGVSPAILDLHHAILKEWERRTNSLLAGEGYFVWPTTDAPPGDGSLSGNAWRAVGMLSALGYHVGSTQGLPTLQRRFLLDQIFAIQLPPLNDRSYMLEWSSPKTSTRLRKLAETLAALTRNAKRRTTMDLQRACEDWQSDLDYLYDKYYVRHFKFGWPTT